MSHQSGRAEKDCLNCGTTVAGRYCQHCGQENVEPKETVAHIASHFFADLTHFDGKFFTTMKDIVVKPGFLSKEYALGRRARYVNPIRLYLFTSAVFFLLFFSLFHGGEETLVQTNVNGKSLDEISKMDSASFAGFTARINKEDNGPGLPMTREQFSRYIDSVAPVSGIHFTNAKYKSRKEYDSVLTAGIKKHNWIERQLIYKEIDLNEKYHNNRKEITSAFSSALLHSLPQMLFISLPFLALLLRFLYVRRKEFYYVSHFIFSVHLYIFLFIAVLVLLSLSRLNGVLHWAVLRFVPVSGSIGVLVYTYLAMKNFYGQGWGKTAVKLILLTLLFCFVLALLFVLLTFFSLFKI